MATKVVMEALSPTMEEGRLVKWLKNEGDAVKTGDILAEVETDKAVMELVARGDGVVRKRLANEGDSSPVGTLLAVIGTADENIDALVAGAAKPAAAAPAPASATPSQNGGAVAAPAPEPASQGTEPAQQPAEVRRPEVAMAQPPLPPSGSSGFGARPAAAAAPSDGKRSRSSPLARRIASERGIALSEVRGSGPGGRIIKKDIESAAKAPPAAASRPSAPKKAPRFITREGDFQDIPNTQIRKTIARRLSESIGPVPTYYLTAEFDAGRAADMRAQLKELGDAYK
ncbi:MAG: biotin/lipoyl-containing protein, partial [Thermoanaerobaculia bacterium]